MDTQKVVEHITTWLKAYVQSSRTEGFIIGISGGVDSALTSILCAMTGLKTIILTMPIRQFSTEYERALKHIADLEERFPNVSSLDIDLTDAFNRFEATMPPDVRSNFLSMANARARLRMTTLYAIGQQHGCLVVGTGNKVEDFGVGFFTKYGDGGVDISPIADLMKTDVWQLAQYLDVIREIVEAKPTDGLWADGRSDEDQLGATYPELEWAMNYKGDESSLSAHQQHVLHVFRNLNAVNKHKMLPIPICEIPESLKQ